MSFLYSIEVFGYTFDISYTIAVAIRTLLAWLCGYVYDFIVILYDLFEKVATVNILEQSDLIVEIYRKIGLILGLFMVFKLSFSLIQHLIDPKTINDNKMGFAQIIKRCIIAIVLLGITPTIFKEAFAIQDLLIGKGVSTSGDVEIVRSNNILYKLIVGVEPDVSEVSFGKTLSSDIYLSFFTDNDEPYLKILDESESGTSNLYQYKDIEDIRNKLRGVSDTEDDPDTEFIDMLYYATLAVENEDDDYYKEFYIEFNGIFCLIIGIVVAWMLILYIIQVGIRVAQLAYLQLIAPVPIFSYISEPDGAFSKWVKQCVATYLDLFIRLMIIYFIVALSNLVLTIYNDVDVVSSTYDAWTKIVILLGLLLFAKKVPELLKDLFPSLGTSAGKFDLGLMSPKKAWNDYIASAPIVGKPLGWFGNKVVGGTAKWAGGLVKKGAIGLGKLTAKPVTVPYNNIKNNIKDWKNEKAEIKADQVKATKEAKKNDAQYKFGEKFVQKYTGSDGKLDKKSLSNEFGGEYKKTYDNVLKHKSNVKNASAALDDAYSKLEAAKLTGDPKAIAAAQKNVSTAKKNLDDAQSLFGKAKDAHSLNMRKKEFAGYAKIENAVNYASDKDEVYNLSLGEDSSLNIDSANISSLTYPNNASSAMPSGNASNAIPSGNTSNAIPFGNASNAIPSGNASNAMPSGNGYVKQYDDSNLIDMVNNVTGVNRPKASDNGAPTAENSLLAQLAERAQQRERQEEFMNRNNHKENMNDSNNTNYVVLEPTKEQLQKYINTPSESREYTYDTQESWDKMIEFATEKLQEMANNGEDELKIQAQIKALENLEEGKRRSKQKDDEVQDNIDDFYEKQNDGFGGQ